MNVATQGTRAAMGDHVVVRLADEGVPISAICRAVRRPFDEIREVLVEAHDAGQLIAIPPSDWPVGTRREQRVPGRPAIALSDLDDAISALVSLYRLTPSEAVILASLVRKQERSKASLHAVIQEGDRVSDMKIVDVFICKLRKKLTPRGISIETVWGRGYLLPAASRTTILQAIKDFEASLAEGG